jgi:hypothetical protein
MVLFRCSYLGHRFPWTLKMARFEESKDGPFNWYIETWVLKKVFHFSVRKFFGTCLKCTFNRSLSLESIEIIFCILTIKFRIYLENNQTIFLVTTYSKFQTFTTCLAIILLQEKHILSD